MNLPIVYIIILNWNGLQDTIECLDTVFKLQYPNFKVVLVDNGSEEDCSTLVKAKYKDIILIKNSSNLGFAGGNNVGIKYALSMHADYIWLLNNDTTVLPETLMNLVVETEKYPDAGIAASKIYFSGSPEKIWFAGAKICWLRGITPHIGNGDIDMGQYDRIQEMDRVTGCSMLVKKEVCKIVGLFDENFFLYNEEVDWCVRSRKAGFKCVYIPTSIVYHKTSVSVSKTGVWNKVFDYYHTRNFLYLVKKSFCSPMREILLGLIIIRMLRFEKRNIIKILLSYFNSSLKLQPSESPALFGVKDFLIGKLGKNSYQFK